MTPWTWILPFIAAAATSLWRVLRRGRLNSTAEFLGALGYGGAVGCVVVVVQRLFLLAWANTWGSA